MSEELEEVNIGELVEDLDKVTIGRDLDEPGWVYDLIGKAVYNGNKITRTPESVTLYTDSGPVIDKSQKNGDPDGE